MVGYGMKRLTERDEFGNADITGVDSADRRCETCKWHEDYTRACFNGDSENCADFTDSDGYCEEREARE